MQLTNVRRVWRNHTQGHSVNLCDNFQCIFLAQIYTHQNWEQYSHYWCRCINHKGRVQPVFEDFSVVRKFFLQKELFWALYERGCVFTMFSDGGRTHIGRQEVDNAAGEDLAHNQSEQDQALNYRLHQTPGTRNRCTAITSNTPNLLIYQFSALQSEEVVSAKNIYIYRINASVQRSLLNKSVLISTLDVRIFWVRIKRGGCRISCVRRIFDWRKEGTLLCLRFRCQLCRRIGWST